MTNFHLRYGIKKSCIWEKPSPSTNANSSTDTQKNTSIFCQKHFFFKWQGVLPAEGEIPCRGASIALRKVLLVQKFLGYITYFFLTTIYIIGSSPLFLKCAEEFQIDVGIFFISKIIKMYNLVISIILANKTPKVSQIMGFFSGKAGNIQDFLKSFFLEKS